MSNQSGAGHLERQEIIIVRRRAVSDEAHHGGVWKIAFADFMTAMMAFFLVMWLTNSSDMATRKQVAQYFNPIKLNNSSPATRGVESKDDGATRETKQNGESKVKTNGDPRGNPLAGDQKGGEEQALFRDPYAVLAEIAAQSEATAGGKHQGQPNGTGLPGLNGGDAYRDPFDPSSWQLAPNTTETGGKQDAAPPAEFKTAVLPPDAPVPADPRSPQTSDAAKTKGGDGTAEKDAAKQKDEGGLAKVTQSGNDKPAPKATRQEAEDVRQDLQTELAKAGAAVPKNLQVSAGAGGVTISLGDDLTTGMFEIGSAKPTAQAIAMMEKIAAVLQKRPGKVIIRGHTDSRPFHSADYDNWRLSTARAHMAYYMLTRGGLDENRVKAIEGVADRDPKLPDDPEAAANRRIEILLVEPKA